MKDILICLAIILFAGRSNAQPILTQANLAPVIGDAYIQYPADTSITPGDSGANRVWTFNHLTIATTPVTLNYVSVSSTPYAATFPVSTIADDDGAGNYNYYSISSSGMVIDGRVES